MSVEQQRAFGRAKNAVLDFLRKRLAVPKIFFDRTWSDQAVDVLAIDRDGVGDVHAVRLISGLALAKNGDPSLPLPQGVFTHALAGLQTVQAQYKYLMLVNTEMDRGRFRGDAPEELKEKTFSPDGLGRVAIGTVDLWHDSESETHLVIKPERFRAFIAKQADEFIRSTPADWEIRPDPIEEEFHA